MTVIAINPARNARILDAIGQEALDLETIRMAPGTVSELDVLDACHRLICSHDWQTRDLAMQVRAGVLSSAAVDDPPPRRAFTLDSLVFWAGIGAVAITLAALLYKSWLNFWIVTEVLVGGV